MNNDQVGNRLKHICNKENITYTEEGINALVTVSQGDLRQAINNLQLTYNGYSNVIPDNVFSNNCLSKWIQLIEDGYTQILAPSPYTLEESAVTIINGYKSSIKESIDLYQHDILNIYKNFDLPVEEGQLVVKEIESHTGIIIESRYGYFEFAISLNLPV